MTVASTPAASLPLNQASGSSCRSPDERAIAAQEALLVQPLRAVELEDGAGLDVQQMQRVGRVEIVVERGQHGQAVARGKRRVERRQIVAAERAVKPVELRLGLLQIPRG